MTPSEKTLMLARSGLINNPDICIKNYGSTIACVCENCRKEFKEAADKLFITKEL